MKNNKSLQNFTNFNEGLNKSDISEGDFKELKTISQLVEFLQIIKEKYGDICVCHSEDHEYWGSVESWLSSGYNLNVRDQAQPDGPKSGKSVKALVFGK